MSPGEHQKLVDLCRAHPPPVRQSASEPWARTLTLTLKGFCCQPHPSMSLQCHIGALRQKSVMMKLLFLRPCNDCAAVDLLCSAGRRIHI